MEKQIDKISEDTKIIYFDEGTLALEMHEDEEIPVVTLKCKMFIFPKESKRKIIEAIGYGLADLKIRPYIVLIPPKLFRGERGGRIRNIKKLIRNFPDPLFFWGEKLYIVPYIREITIYEDREDTRNKEEKDET